MRSDSEISSLDSVFEGLQIIWGPGAEALRVQQALNVRSLEDTAAAAERAGYQVCYVDLPANVSGFAMVIEGRPYIVINRAKSPQHWQYTVPHELGHHVLHLNPSRDVSQLGASSEGVAEFQAHLFAATWVIQLANDQEREDVLRRNPELFAIPILSIFVTFALILIALLVPLWSRVFRIQLPGSVETK